MTKIKIWLEDSKTVIFERDSIGFNEIVKEVFKDNIFTLVKKEGVSLAINRDKILVVEELKI